MSRVYASRSRVQNVVLTPFFLILLVGVFVYAGAESVSFLRDLRLGDEGEDVRFLQKTLNLMSETSLGEAGPGSPGQETHFFGPRTREAVRKFQEFYAEDILSPVGISAGTGFVGPQTRKKLNEIIATPRSDLAELSTAKKTAPRPNLDKPEELIFFFPSAYSGVPGESVTLFGSGFSWSGNSVFFGDKTVPGLSSSDGGELTFSIPDTQPGRYKISIGAEGKISNSHYFHVVVQNAISPFIKSITPSVIENGGTVTIIGKQFTRTQNTVYTGYGVVEDVSSFDGETLIISVDSPYQKSNGTDLREMPLWFFVENDNGFSNEYVVLLKL